MTNEQLEELESFLLHTDIVTTLFQHFSEEDVVPGAECLAKIFWGYKRDPFLLQQIIHTEVSNSATIELAFREESVVVRLIKEVFALHAKKLINKTIAPIIKSLLSNSRLDFELNPAKISEIHSESKGKTLTEQEIEELISERTKEIISVIFKIFINFEKAVPMELKNFAKILKYQVDQSYPGNSYRLLGGKYIYPSIHSSIHPSIHPSILFPSLLFPPYPFISSFFLSHSSSSISPPPPPSLSFSFFPFL